MPPAFFISYRRSQNRWQARDIRRELARRYGDASVFMDTSSIEYGESFPDRIASAIRGCSLMLVLIGPHWLEPIVGPRRIDDPHDWVRREIEAGLQRQEAVVIPALLDGAIVPADTELPESVKRLAALHAVAIIGDDLAPDIDNLVKSVERARRRAAQRDGGSPATVPLRNSCEAIGCSVAGITPSARCLTSLSWLATVPTWLAKAGHECQLAKYSMSVNGDSPSTRRGQPIPHQCWSAFSDVAKYRYRRPIETLQGPHRL